MKAIKQIHLRVSGGMGIPIEGSIDVDALPPELARHVQKTLSPRRLARLARRPRASLMTDQITYEITLPDDRQDAISYTILESQADDDLLEVLDELTARIIEAKMRERRAARKRRQARERREAASSQAAPMLIFPAASPTPPGNLSQEGTGEESPSSGQDSSDEALAGEG